MFLIQLIHPKNKQKNIEFEGYRTVVISKKKKQLTLEVLQWYGLKNKTFTATTAEVFSLFISDVAEGPLDFFPSCIMSVHTKSQFGVSRCVDLNEIIKGYYLWLSAEQKNMMLNNHFHRLFSTSHKLTFIWKLVEFPYNTVLVYKIQAPVV